MGRSSGRTKVCRDAQKLCLFDCNQSVYTTDSRKCLSGVFTHRSYVAIRGLHTPELFSRGTLNEGKAGATDTCRGKLEGDPPTGGKKIFSRPAAQSCFQALSQVQALRVFLIPLLYIFLLCHLSRISVSLLSYPLMSYLSPLSYLTFRISPSSPADVDLFQTFVNRCI